MENNITKTFSKFLHSIGAKVTKTSVEEFIEKHPDHDTMVAYVDALEKWNIEYAALKVSDDDYLQMPTPHITYLRRNGGTFAVVKKVTSDTIEWYDTNTGWVKDFLSDFKNDWSRVVLLAETNDKSGEIEYVQKRKKEIWNKSRLPLSITLIAVSIMAFTSYSNFLFTLLTIPLLILKLSGLVIVTLLLVKSIDSNNDFVNKLCNVGKKVSCQSILDSEAAKITSWLSWSDLGFIYFSSTLISFLLCGSSPTNLNFFFSLQFIFSSIGVLFSFYSIYYQAFIAKIWCPLCLGVIAIFWLELFTLSTYFYNSAFSFLITNYIVAFCLVGLSLPIAFLLLFKKTAIEAIETKKLKSELIKLKSNPEVFETLMRKQRRMQFIPQGMGVITLGNPEAEHTLTMVSNPLCTPCAKMHLRIETVLAKTSNLKCQVIFNTDPNGSDVGGQFVRKVFSIKPEQQHQAITDWSSNNNRNFNQWNKPYININEKDIAKIWQKEHSIWTNEAEVKRTPTLFFNGYLLPNIIKVEELEYIIQNQKADVT